MARHAIWVLWPSFLVAGGAEFVFFSVFDPHELVFFGRTLEVARETIYTAGFLGFWAVGAVSATLTLWLKGGREAA